MNKIYTMFLSAALVAPLFLSAPAQAQSYDDIQRLEVQVQEAKNNGNWEYAQQLERQLNVQRLNFQRSNGLGEAQGVPYNNGRYNNRYYNNNQYYNNGYYNNYRYDNRGHRRHQRQDNRRRW